MADLLEQRLRPEFLPGHRHCGGHTLVRDALDADFLAGQVLLHEDDGVVAAVELHTAGGEGVRRGQVVLRLGLDDADAAADRGGLDDDRVPDGLGRSQRLVQGVRCGGLGRRNAVGGEDGSAGGLVPAGADRLHAGSGESELLGQTGHRGQMPFRRGHHARDQVARGERLPGGEEAGLVLEVLDDLVVDDVGLLPGEGAGGDDGDVVRVGDLAKAVAAIDVVTRGDDENERAQGQADSEAEEKREGAVQRRVV